MSNGWKYKDTVITSLEDIPVKNAVGFIYIITQKSTGKLYLGKKLLTKAASKTIKGVKKKLRKESDWLSYWSSSPKIQQWIEESGTDDFEREILVFASSKGSMVYLEEFGLYEVGALESDKWINENIRSKVYRTWCKPEEAKELRSVLKDYLP